MNPAQKLIAFSISVILLTLSCHAVSLTFIENVKGYTLNQHGKLITFSNIAFEDEFIVGMNLKQSSRK
jgi:hypothetical protein